MKIFKFFLSLSIVSLLSSCWLSTNQQSEQQYEESQNYPHQEDSQIEWPISDSVIIMYYEEFEQRTRIEHINKNKLRSNMIGAHMYANCKPENFKIGPHTAKPKKFVIDLYAKHKGARRFFGCKIIIGEKVYEIPADQYKNLGNGNFVGACLMKMYYDTDMLMPLAEASNVKVKFLFDNGDYETTLTKKDIQVYSDMYYVFKAHGGEIDIY